MLRISLLESTISLQIGACNSRTPRGDQVMRRHARKFTGVELATFAGACAVALAAAAFAADYQMTVNRDRLFNAQNEPQNWLLMNGDYGSTRYSKLTQINRDNVKNLRLVWGLALGGMQDVGQNGPESEVNPLMDNGFMYTTDGWGTVYKIDARNPNKGEFVWTADPGLFNALCLVTTRDSAPPFNTNETPGPR